MRKIPTRLCGTNFFTSSARFALSFVRQPNSPECTQIVGNATKHEFRVQWGGSGAFVVKNSDATSFCSEIGNKMVPNAPKWYKTHQNMSLGSNGVDQLRSSRKTPTRLRGTNFCTRSARSAPSFEKQPNGPKCTQIVRNSPKHEIRVQWGGSGAFVAKNFRCNFIAQTCPLIAPVRPVLHRVS